jgi:hypothetical protein
LRTRVGLLIRPRLTALEEVGLAMKLLQPDFFWRQKNRK